jgi:AmmeMemoRadiSam system protein A
MFRLHEIPSVAGASPEFSAEERAALLRAAREAIASTLESREISLDGPSPHLNEPRGVFTTIYCAGGLRGCVGYVLPVVPLYRTVIETARSAAFEDSRFAPVRPEELPELRVSLSVLSVPLEINPEQIEIGRHGLIVTYGASRGLLLPQVAAEHGWDQETFLAQTCRKAGLPSNAWKCGATLEAFTAEVFSDWRNGAEGAWRV